MPRVFDTPLTTNDQSIDRVLAANLPLAVVFLDGAPSQGIDQVMNRLAREYAGKVLVVKVQTKDSPAAVRRYQIAQTPAVVVIRNGQVLSKADGVSDAQLDGHIRYAAGAGPKPEAQPSSQQTASQRTSSNGRGTGSSQQPATGGKPVAVTDATFDREVMQSSLPVLVDFWAPWCGPCRMTNPIVEKFAREMASQLKVAKVNVDENPMTGQRFGVQGIPTMMIVKNGKIVDQWVGALPEGAMRSRIGPVISR